MAIYVLYEAGQKGGIIPNLSISQIAPSADNPFDLFNAMTKWLTDNKHILSMMFVIQRIDVDPIVTVVVFHYYRVIE